MGTSRKSTVYEENKNVEVMAANTGNAEGELLGVIGGSGLLRSSLFSGADASVQKTEYGDVVLRETVVGGSTRIVFVQRHAADPNVEYTPPHLINHCAIAAALRDRGVKRALGVCSVGSLDAERFPTGSFVVPEDFFCPADIISLHKDARGHHMPEFDTDMRARILNGVRTAKLRNPIIDSGVYVQTRGPRFETKAEIRFFATVGSVVGMTGAHEAGVCSDAGIKYAMLCMVDNLCNGIVGDGALEGLDDFHAKQAENKENLEAAISSVLSGAAPGQSETSKVPVDLIVAARWVIPMRADSPEDVLERHAVVVNEERIVDILPFDDAIAEYSAKTVERMLDHHVLMPGMVNGHTHSPMTLLRGYADDMPLLEWLTTKIFPAEGKWATREFVRDGTALAIAEMIRSGTTCFNDMYFFTGASAEAVVESGIRAMLGLCVLEFPTLYASSPDDYIAKGKAVYEKYAGESLISMAWCPHAPYTVSEDTFRRIKSLAEEMDTKIHLHLHETLAEVKESEAGNRASMSCHQSDAKCRPFENLQRLGVIGNRLIAAHMVHLSESEQQACADSGVSIAHCPCSNMKLASGFAPIASLISKGVCVSVGTDGCSSNNSLDMLQETKTAAILAKAVAQDASTLPAVKALRMATLDGAKALGLDDVTGSLEKEKYADMVAVSMDCVECTPVYNIFSQLIYATTRDRVTDSWCAGRRLMQNRRLTTVDEADVRAKAQTWRRKIAEWAQSL